MTVYTDRLKELGIKQVETLDEETLLHLGSQVAAREMGFKEALAYLFDFHVPAKIALTLAVRVAQANGVHSPERTRVKTRYNAEFLGEEEVWA